MNWYNAKRPNFILYISVNELIWITSCLVVDEWFVWTCTCASMSSCFLTHPSHSHTDTHTHTHQLPSFLIRKSLKDIQREAAYYCGNVLFLTSSVSYDSQSPMRPSDAIRKDNFEAWLNQVTTAAAECWIKCAQNFCSSYKFLGVTPNSSSVLYAVIV